jgi:plasmid stabilization system protein ParE
MHLRFSKLALDDLTLIHDYTVGEWGEDQAVKYVNALWDALEEISAAPERWRLRPDIYEGCQAAILSRSQIEHFLQNSPKQS